MQIKQLKQSSPIVAFLNHFFNSFILILLYV